MTFLSPDIAAGLQNIVGKPHLLLEEAVLRSKARTTGFQEIAPIAVVRPASTEEVQALVKFANTHHLKLYPTSQGKNWGYGDAAPSGPDQIICDLSRMNQIREVNSQLCYAIIEPGVTQGQLAEHLKKNHPDLWMDSTGAGKSCSIIGNYADRGFGHTRYADHFLSACRLRVVLGNGSTVETGFGGYLNSEAKNTFKWGVGPILDGLFSQSNFGIITEMTLFLMPKPEDYCLYMFRCETDQQLADISDLLATLRLQGIIQSAVHIVNDLRAISGKTRYPWDLAGGKTPLSEQARKAIRDPYNLGRWTGTGIITGPPEMVKALRSILEKRLMAYTPLFLAKSSIEKDNFPAGKSKDEQGLHPDLVNTLINILTGFPADDALPGAAWRVRGPKKQIESDDPLDHDAGLAWISPILPMTTKSMGALLKILPPIFEGYGFDFLATFTPINERSFVLVSNVSFDRRLKEETIQAKACYDKAIKALIKFGFMPYRISPASIQSIRPGNDPFWETCEKLKNALDPKNVISPGRYVRS